VYACTPLDGRLLEGYIDSSTEVRTASSWSTQTAATSDPQELDRRVEGYRIQGASYALIVAATTAERVVRVTFLFLTPDGLSNGTCPTLMEPWKMFACW